MLNLDLSQHNPVQSDSQYANVPLPSAHLVVIEESEMKDSVKDGFTKGMNLLLEMTILASSTGNEYVGAKLPLYIPFSGFEETAIKAGMKRLSTLAYTLGVGGFLQNKEDLHGTNFIVVLEKDGKSNFPRFKRILNAQGMEIADASGNFKPCELKDVALATELEKLLAIVGGGMQSATQIQGGAITQGTITTGSIQGQQITANVNFVPDTQVQVTQANFGNAQQVQQTQQQFTPQNNFGGQYQGANFGNPATSQTAQAPNFGNAQAQGGFGGNVPNQPAWGQTVNQNNGQ